MQYGLKAHTQAKIIKNRWFYFGFLIWPYDVGLNMSIDWNCNSFFLNFCAAHLPVRLDIETQFLISFFEQPCKKIRNTGLPSLYLAELVNAQHEIF